MNCAVCDLRGSVGFCAECKILLCEECGITCERCGKMACPKHVYTTSSGRQICTVCQAERRERRSKQRTPAPAPKEQAVESTSFEALEGAAAEGAEVPVSAEALTLSGRALIPPWKLSAFAGLGSLISILIIFFFPTIWTMLLGMNPNAAIPFLIILIPLLPAFLGFLWAVGGFLTSPYYEDRAKCLIGFGLSVVAVIMGLMVAARAPSYIASTQPAIFQETGQENMTPEQLEQWRKDLLRRFSR